MQPILTPSWPFHTIIVDYILGLSTSPDSYDTILSITDKFSKAMTLIPEQKNMTEED